MGMKASAGDFPPAPAVENARHRRAASLQVDVDRRCADLAKREVSMVACRRNENTL